MQMIFKNTSLEAVKLITQLRHDDERGAFVKTFHHANFKDYGIDFQMQESFYSISKQNVLRGMHFHHAPKDHAKIVFCSAGKILDVALDIRKNSDTFGQYFATELSAEMNNALYIPKGFAHGFLTLSASATTQYFVDGMYSQEHDDGILYDSFGMDWGVSELIINQRDKNFLSLANYQQKYV
jgi:dTDP-4-dehydrorhamnose 3,5-epimerase